MADRVKVAIVGGTGYTGVELLRLLSGHPNVEIAVVTSREQAGRPVSGLFESLRGHCDIAFTEPDNDLLAHCDVVFFATPNGTAMRHVPALLEAGTRVIDLAADFRLRDAELWAHWYGEAHLAPEYLAEAVYGLPEFNRAAVARARLIANPGCYPTAVQLGLMPLLEAGVIDERSIVADCKSGVSGAGRKAAIPFLFAEMGASFKAYGVSGHRHLPEIQQGLSDISGRPVELTFVPHLVPMVRGIHATIYVDLTDPEADLQSIFETRYRDEAFVDVLPLGTHPETRSVAGSNLCRLSVHRLPAGNKAVVLSVIDNLVKGAAGQAVQNMNLMLEFAEGTGLGQVALSP